jgi:hypothetical protein
MMARIKHLRDTAGRPWAVLELYRKMSQSRLCLSGTLNYPSHISHQFQALLLVPPTEGVRNPLSMTPIWPQSTPATILRLRHLL